MIELVKKAVYYRLISFLIILLLTFIFTGRYETSVFIAISELIIKTFIYYSFEVYWGARK